MARGGARPGAGRKAGKSANTSPVSRARAPAREAAGNQRPWPADKVERWAIDRLIPYAKNARTHTDAQVAAIAASIKETSQINGCAYCLDMHSKELRRLGESASTC
jgi:AhpD family alkylhydroperoxidase